MRFFKVNGMYINLDNIKGFFIRHVNGLNRIEYWNIYADEIKVSEHRIEKTARTALDVMMAYIKEGKDKY